MLPVSWYVLLGLFLAEMAVPQMSPPTTKKTTTAPTTLAPTTKKTTTTTKAPFDCGTWCGTEELGFCYKHFMCEPRMHSEAEARCVKLGGHLASINTPEENTFVHELSKLDGRFPFSAQPWIGLVKTESNEWIWTDGSTGNGYKWAPDQPDNNNGIENCGILVSDVLQNGDSIGYSGKTAVVNDARCYFNTTRFICKRKPEDAIAMCPPDAVETGGGCGCECKPGNTDILDTDFPNRENYERGNLCVPDEPCKNVVESLSVIFVVDSSGSIGSAWPSVIDFLKTAASMIPKSSRVGFVKFSGIVTAADWLKNGWTEAEFKEGIPSEHDWGLTNTAAALDKAREMMENETSDKKVVVLVTDGLPNNQENTKNAAEQLKTDGSSLLLVGIGTDLRYEYDDIMDWLENPETDYFAFHESILLLSSTHMKLVTKKVCDTPPAASNEQDSSGASSGDIPEDSLIKSSGHSSAKISEKILDNALEGLSGESSGDAPAESSGDCVEESSGNSSGESSGELTEDSLVESSGESSGDAPAESSGDCVEESSGNSSGESSGELTEDSLVESSGESSGDAPAESSGDCVEEPSGNSSGESSGELTEDSLVESSGESSGDAPAESSGDCVEEPSGNSSGESSGELTEDSLVESSGESSGDAPAESSGDCVEESSGDSSGESSEYSTITTITTSASAPTNFAPTTEKTKTTTAHFDCGKWRGTEELGFCYKHFMCKPRMHSEAEARCVKLGGHLASINTPEENTFVHELSKLDGRFPYSAQPWIGLVKTESKQWIWTDGSTGNGYKWAPDQPNNYKGIENCGILVSDVLQNGDSVGYNGKTAIVNDARCYFNTTRFICKRKPEDAKPLCPPDAVETEGGCGCECKPGNTDILDTDFPGKESYERGQLCVPDEPCKNVTETLSVIFVVDSSGSMDDDWSYVIDFLKTAASMIPKSSRVGFVKFSGIVTAADWLKNGWTEAEFKEGIPSEHDWGLTNTAAALDKAREMMENETSDKKVVVLITDGIPNIEPYDMDECIAMTDDAAEQLKSDGSYLIALGIGEDIWFGAELVVEWLENPETDYFAFHESISLLSSTHMKLVTKRVCNTPPAASNE